MKKLAPEFGAILVSVQHRYYGESVPFGGIEDPKDVTKTGYFTTEQSIADQAEIINHLKSTIPGADKSPVILFGGSYSGMLAAWARIKYPHLIDG